MRLLHTDFGPDPGVDSPAAECWFIHDIRHANSAAKFWSKLAGELLDLAGYAGRVRLGSAACPLSRDLLFPQAALQRDIDRFEGLDLGAWMRETFAALELLGPPALIRWQLFRGQTRLAEGVLGSDVADAETLAYLAAWLLEWGGVPPRAWNQAEVSAGFRATDRGQGLALDVGFSMRLTPLADGLYERQVDFGIHATDARVGETS